MYKHPTGSVGWQVISDHAKAVSARRGSGMPVLPLGVILYADEYQAHSARSRSNWGLYMTLGNLPMKVSFL